ncbi:VOC family protein [Rhodococcus qingshengii]|uniref:VOC family protein n=1 Tax=Rhodococcus qingshengii TaxID=334542 RepID=UPI00365D16E9
MPLSAKLFAVTVDCPQPRKLAEFYQKFLGGQLRSANPDFVVLTREQDVRIDFQRVHNHVPDRWPSPDAPRRLHLDFSVDDLPEAEEQLHDLGAELASHQPGGQRFRVFLDQRRTPVLRHLISGGSNDPIRRGPERVSSNGQSRTPTHDKPRDAAAQPRSAASDLADALGSMSGRFDGADALRRNGTFFSTAYGWAEITISWTEKWVLRSTEVSVKTLLKNLVVLAVPCAIFCAVPAAAFAQPSPTLSQPGSNLISNDISTITFAGVDESGYHFSFDFTNSEYLRLNAENELEVVRGGEILETVPNSFTESNAPGVVTGFWSVGEGATATFLPVQAIRGDGHREPRGFMDWAKCVSKQQLAGGAGGAVVGCVTTAAGGCIAGGIIGGASGMVGGTVTGAISCL